MSETDLDFAKNVLETEANAILHLRDRLGNELTDLVERILDCDGRLVATGMGKTGLVARKLSSTLASTGTPSLYLHPAEAYHGDLGRVTNEDLVLMLSNSGETEELLRLVEPLRGVGPFIAAITSDNESSLGQHADLTLEIGDLEEACPMGLAPSSSSTAMLALGDAISLTVLENRDFNREEYARYHPGGSLGRKLMKVRELMREGDKNPIVNENTPVREALVTITGARAGAINVVNEEGKLSGIFTDGDLRRLTERGEDNFSKRKIRDVMTTDPITVQPDQLATEAGRIMKEKKVDELPVVDGEHVPVGMLDLQDILEAKLVE